MSDDDRRVIGQRLSTRVETGLHFVEFEYLNRHLNPDLAWIRNIYILMSFYTELLLKGIFVMKGNFSNKTKLEKRLRDMSHNLEKIGHEIGKDVLKEFGIINIKKNNPDYLIETVDGNYKVEDFIDIRYDFLEGKIRTIYGNEHEMFRVQINSMRSSNQKLKDIVW
ncbi:MAG: hypothetical protein ACYCY6_00095 [Minisyncoccota bacterium]